MKVHCGKEFAPGNLYVAFSRVGSREQLHVAGFDFKRSSPAPKVVLNFFNNNTQCSCRKRPFMLSHQEINAVP